MTDTVPDLYRLAFMPGCFRCPTCDFTLTKSAIDAYTGAVGTRDEDRDSEPCPNDGTMMVYITYKEQLEGYASRLREEFACRPLHDAAPDLLDACADRLAEEFARVDRLEEAIRGALFQGNHCPFCEEFVNSNNVRVHPPRPHATDCIWRKLTK